MRSSRLFLGCLAACLAALHSHPACAASDEPLLPGINRVVVLGDSITYGGPYVAYLEAYVRFLHPQRTIQFLNLGLPSETVSGLSEPGHAGGAFPRPDLHERLERVLSQTRPDLVIACYGMNDGIYYPFGQDRFQAYQAGVRRLRDQVLAAQADLILVTPPVFDPVPIHDRTLPAGQDEYRQPYQGYNEVLDLYAAWLMAQRSQGWKVVDAHTPMNQFLAAQRAQDPSFRLAGDGVHINDQGHWLVAREILRFLGAQEVQVPEASVLWANHPHGQEVVALVEKKHGLLKDAWLTQTGHQRPGMNRGLPLAEATEQAANLDQQINTLLNPTADTASKPPFPGNHSTWHGFDAYEFPVAGHSVTVVVPHRVAPGRPWVWHGEFFGHKPNPDIALLGRGFHAVYVRVPDLLGAPKAVTAWDQCYEELTRQYGLARKVALVGLSRGGLYCYNWATANPDQVACIYGDAPVCDFKSWPGGQGTSQGSARDWQLVLEHYGFKDEAEAMAYDKNPIDNLAPLAAHGVPLLHVFGDADEVVPWEENTGLLAERYRQLGGDITLIRKPGVGHHPHGLDDSTPIIQFLWNHAAGNAAQAWSQRHGGGPLDRDGRPLIRKLGTLDLDLVETTPVVFQGKLHRFEWVRSGYWNNQTGSNYFRFVEHDSGKPSAPFAFGCEFGSAFVEGNRVFVTGTHSRSEIHMFSSTNLQTWQSWPVLQDPGFGIFNTSLCRTAHDYVLMFEIDRPAEQAGHPFTARFLRSKDLKSWSLTPPECCYAKDRYSAPHCLRWQEGWFYNFYLEAHQGYEMRVVRSQDLIHWLPSPLNPVLRASPQDQIPAASSLSPPQITRIKDATNLNNSDIDFCPWQGRLIINYSWGNQQGAEFLAEALYDGTLQEFLLGWFPD